MQNHAQTLIRDLLSDEYQMLHQGDLPPERISLFYHPQANEEVQQGLSRIEETMCECLNPDNVYSEPRRYLGSATTLNKDTLLLIMYYQDDSQRVLALTLNAQGARLSFHKKS
jgi:hypothetical protein